MNPEIVNKFMTEMLELLKSAKDFTMDQAPQVAREIVQLQFVTNVTWATIAFVCFLFTYFKIQKWVSKQIKECSDAEGPCFIMLLVLYGVEGAAFLGNLLDAIKVTVAPRVYLIEYLSNLLAQHK